MTTPHRYWRYLFIALGLATSGCSSGSSDEPAPDFRLTSVDGRGVSVSDFKGKVVLINFWAVGCMPCRMELPHLKALHEKHKGELVILAVNAWDEPPELVKEFAKAENVPFIVLTGGGKVFQEQYRGGGIPMGVLVDRKGNITFRHIGIDKERMRALDKKLQQLLG